MAEEIKLVGNFTDNITPKLRKLSKAIDDVAKSFTKIQKKLRPITKEMGRLAMASERVADALKEQKKAIDANSRSWSNYKKEVGQAAGAQRKAFKGVPRGGTAAPRVPRSTSPRGGGAFVGGGTGALTGIGFQLSNMIIGGIVKGFEIGTNLLQMPFKFFMNGLGERIQDEMSDIKAAGGIFAISKRMDDPLVRSFAEAESLTKETNRYLAELAGALPGDTQQYIQVAKQISDSIGQIISNDKAASLEIGKQLAMTRGADTTVFDAGGQVALQAAFKEMTGELTKQTVLASGGSKMGAMGLPQLTEQMISQDNLTTGMFQRYSAVFRDPQIMSALERNLDEINKTAKSSGARFQAIQKMYEEVVTPEYVRRVQRSTEGVVEAMRTTFMNPEVGLLGLGRPVELAGDASNDLSIKFDHFGRMLDENNKVTTDVTKAVRESLSLFEYLRDIFANLMIVLQPVMDALTSLYDPFVGLARELDGLRKATMAFQLSFEQANVMLDNAAKDLKGEALKNFNTSKSLRASLMAVTKGFMQLGAFSPEEAFANIDMLMDSKTTSDQLQEMITVMIDKFLNSVAGYKIGGTLGKIIGKVIKTFADILTGVFGDKTLKNQFVTGFVEGFKGAGGAKAIKDIFDLVFDKIFDLVKTVITTFPKEAAVLGAITFAPMVLPALPGLLGQLGPALKIVTTGLTKLGQVFRILSKKGGLAKLLGTFGKRIPLIGGAIAGLVKLLEGGNIVESIATAIGSAGGVAIGMAIGSIFGPIGTIIGGFIGGSIGEMDLVVSGLTSVLGELWSSVSGSLGGLMDLFGIVFTLMGDLGSALKFAIDGILTFLGVIEEGEKGVNLMMLAFAPLTLAFQLLEMGIRGLVSAFTWARMSLVNINPLATEEEKQQARDDFQGSENKRAEAQGRINAYNALMSSSDELKRQLNNAVYEYQNDKNLSETRSKELKSFIDEARKKLAESTKKKPETPTATPTNPVSAFQVPQAPSAPISVPPSAPAPVIAAAAQQTSSELPKIAQNTAKTPPQIGKVAAYLKTLCDKVDLHGKATTAKITETKAQIAASSNNIQAKMGEISSKLDSGINVKIVGTPTVLAKFDIGGSGPKGGPGALNASAAAMGLTMTSGFRPGDDGYHGIDRARDYAGSPADMKKFATFVSSTMGTGLKELIYTPLGYSIKNGAVVPPYAQDTHYDHVHVAYGKGAGQPAFFSSQKEAINWEKKMAPSNEMVKSVTSHTGETGRGSVDIGGINVTVNAATTDGDEIANLVAGKVLTAVQQATFTELDVT